MSASASGSASASASTSNNASSTKTTISPSLRSPPPTSQPSTSTHASTLPHSPETLRQIAEARAALEASMLNIGQNLSQDLQSRAQNLHANSAQLDKQMKDVEKVTKTLRGQNDKLGKMAQDGMVKMKELGNVQNWAEMLERDFLVLEETMRLAREGSEGSEGSWSSGSESGDGERSDESLAGDVRREGIGRGFEVREEEMMGFLDVYGLEDGMDGVETEGEEGKGNEGKDTPTKTPMERESENAVEKRKGKELGDVEMSGGYVEPVDKGKGKEINANTDLPVEDRPQSRKEAVEGLSTALGSSTTPSVPFSVLAASANLVNGDHPLVHEPSVPSSST